MDTTQEGVSVREAAEALLADEQQPESENTEVENEEEVVTEDVTEDEVEEAVDEADAEPTDEADSQDANEESELPSKISDFAEAAGVEVDDLYNLELPIKVDGEESTATLREIVKGYQLEKYANQKSIKVTEQQKALEAEYAQKMDEVGTRVNQLDESLQLNGAQLTAKWQNVDWEALKVNDPQEFLMKQSEYNNDVAFIQNQYQLLQQGKEQMQAHTSEQLQAQLAEEQNRTLEVIPEWSDDSVRTKDVQVMTEYLNEYGYTSEQIEAITDHRMLRVLKDAIKGREVTQKLPKITKKVQRAPKKVQPGKAQKGLDGKIASLKKRADAGDFQAAVELQVLAEKANRG